MNRELSSYFEGSEFKEILNKYKGMVESHTPTYFDAEELADLADYYIHIGEEEESEKIVDYSLQLHPNNTDALIFKIRSLTYKGQKEEAYKLIDLIEDQTDREVLFLKADLLMDEGQIDKADRIYQALAENENESLEVLCDIALCYLDANNKEYSFKWISYIKDKGYSLKNNQKFRDLWCDYCMTLGNPQEAVDVFKMTLDKHPYSIKHWNGLTKCYLSLNDMIQAHESVDFSLAIDMNDQEANELKAFCYMQDENFAEAIHIFQKLLHAEILNKDRIYGLLAQCYTQSNQMEEALKYYKLWLHHGKLTEYEKAEVYALIAMCYCNLNRPSEGLSYINIALTIDPFFYGNILQKATMHMQLGEDRIAETLIQKALEICPESDKKDLYMSIASSYFFLKRYDDTIVCCNMTMNEYPDTKLKSLIMIANSYHEMNMDEQALAYTINALDYMKEIGNSDPKIQSMLNDLVSEMRKIDQKFNLDNYF